MKIANKRYGFLHSELKDGKWVTYKPVTTNDLSQALDMYKYYDDKNAESDAKVHEIAVFDYEKLVYVKDNFQLFRA